MIRPLAIESNAKRGVWNLNLLGGWTSVIFVFIISIQCFYACSPRPTTAPTRNVHPNLMAVSKLSPLTISDTLESLIADGKDTEADRRFAYHVVSQQRVHASEEAFARAAVAGRLAEISGLNAGSLVAEAEHFARLSLAKDRNFRKGAAQRMLGTLYVLAPGVMLKHGDSEDGIALLRQLVAKWPQDVENHLRLAEAYIALNDEEPATAHLCLCIARKHELRRDEGKLLESLIEDIDLERCNE
ncbi:MAG: tetratricopeptide repeat protein [Deltaproteobacteria bacterium]|nr:tetratricopeptide repeat protein [Deltaproteobacteria bacterium]